MKKRSTLPVLLAAVAVSAMAVYYAATEPDGEELFGRENCAKCHALRGRGLGNIDLTGVAERKSRAWLRDQIAMPKLHEPHPGMPSFAHLSGREIDALIDHIKGE